MTSKIVFMTMLAAIGPVEAASLFTAGSPFATGNRPTGIAIGDFNGDGKQDLAVANARDNTVTVLLGNGLGGFAQAAGSPITVGAFPFAILAKDFNKDGKTDLAVLNTQSNNVSILLGNGAGGFAAAPGSPVAVGAGSQYMATGDFNGDTVADLAVTSTGGNTVTVLLGNGSGGFAPSAGSPFHTGPDPEGVIALDLNKDGKTDLAIADQIDDFVTTLLGNGAGGFTTGSSNEGAAHATVLTRQANLIVMTSGDFFNRGVTDVISASYGTNEINLLKNDGLGNLYYTAQFPAGGPLGIISGDFDGDGNLDVAVVGTNSNMQIFLGDGAGNFNVSAATTFATGNNPYGIATADFNGDGKPDIVVTNQNDNTVSVFLSVIAVAPVIPVTPPATPVAPAAAPQTIFLTIADHFGSDAPFPVQASATSGLPVSLNVLGGPATISGNMLTLTGLGTVIVLASQPGNSFFAPASAIQRFNVTVGLPTIQSIVNGASFSAGPVPASYYATLFGNNLASGSTLGDANRTQTLEGTSLTVTDSTKQTVAATISFISFGQINFVAPAGLAPGPATVTVTNATGKSASIAVTVGPIAPGVFSADGTGKGGAAADVLVIAADGSQTVQSATSCTPFLCSPQAIPLTPGAQVYLILFGTGIRGRSGLAGVSVTIGGTPATVTYAAAQGNYAGVDQVDVLIPGSMAGAGTVDVKLTIDGIAANTVKIRF